MEEQTAETAETEPQPARYVVRYGTMRLLAEFEAKRRATYSRGEAVIVRSERGVEWGTVLTAATDRTRDYMSGSGRGSRIGRILRAASDEDRRSRDDNAEREREYFRQSSALISERRMQMQLVDVEQVFGGERLILYYLSEKRVDFRELVKQLAREFNMRIEMRQIGVRDEARLLADYGDCGKPVCCNTHLQEMPPVSMKMAKLQKATLDPSKISGRCGRLKCCLRYEYETYEAHLRELPPVGSTVVTKAGQGRVVSQELLARKLLISYEDGRRLITDESDVVTVVSRRGSSQRSSR